MYRSKDKTRLYFTLPTSASINASELANNTIAFKLFFNYDFNTIKLVYENNTVKLYKVDVGK